MLHTTTTYHWNSQGALKLVQGCNHRQYVGVERLKSQLVETIADWNSNLNPISPFKILIMRHWNSQGAVKLVKGCNQRQ